MKILCKVWAILSLTMMCIGFFPCLGWVNWFNIPFSATGLVLLLAWLLTSRKNKSNDYLFVIVSLSSAIILGILRLFLGIGFI